MTWNPFYRFPAIALSVLIIAALPFVGHIRDFKINSQVEILLAGDQRNFQSYQKIKEVISTSIPVFVSMKVENIYSPEGISAIHRVSEAFYDMPGFLDAKSLTHSYKPVRSGMSFDMIPLASTNAMDPESLSRLRDYCRENPLVRNIITAPDDQHNIIWLNFVGSFATNPSERTAQLKNFHQQILDRLKPFEKEGISFKIIGVPLVENEVYQTIMSDARSFIGLSLLVLLVLFGVTFRSLWATVLVGMNLVFTFILIPLVFVICRFELTVFNLVLLPLLGVIHLTLLTHLFLAFLAALKSGVEHPVGSAVSKIWKSSAFASLTTAVSFGSLALSDVKQVALFGILGAIGMLILFFISFGPGLSVLCLASRFRLFKRGRGQSDADQGDEVGWPDKLVSVTTGRAPLVLMSCVCVLVFIAVGLTRVRTDVRIEEFLSRQSPTREMMHEMNEVYGGMNILQLVIDSGKVYGITSLEFLNYLRDIEVRAGGFDGVTGVHSFSQVIAMMNQVWEREKPGSLSIPDSSFKVTLFVGALKSQNLPFMTTLCDEDLRTANLIIRTRNMPSDQYLALVDKLVALTEDKAPDGVSVSAKATIKSLIDADRRILRSQTDTAGMTVVIVFLLLISLWRSVRMGFISMVANLLPVTLVIALTGWFSIPLNSITIMVGAIAFGIAVDDSVHFLTYLRELRQSEIPDAKASLVHAFHVKGRPIFFTSVMLIAVFLLLTGSSFPPIVHFGFLGAAAFAGALVSIFVLIPAMDWVMRSRSDESATSAAI